ncbi:MAG: flagellar basal body-associated FliL family protein [Burkholderiaceae bacterium]|nr:flagellar basal body-associated FliL family protein [Burkholderiaceae bacterium]
MAEAASVELEAPRPNRGKKWTLIVAIVVVLAATAGAAMQFLGASADGEQQTARTRAPVFVSLEQFTVNLADEGGERFAQIGVTLEVADEQADKVLRGLLPSVRNSVLLLLSSKKSEELLTLEGKKLLASQIAAGAAREMGWSDGEKPNPIVAVNFSHFIIQ